jgi:hypothetical protein
MFCTNCGSQNADNATFCTNCGAPFQQQTPVAPVAPPAYNPAPAYVPAPVFSAPTKNPGIGFGVASLILGIISLILFCFWYVSVPCALIGLILAAVGKKSSSDAGMSNGLAVGGLVCSIIALGLLAFFWIFAVDAYYSWVNSLL